MKSGWPGSRDIPGTTVLRDRARLCRQATKQKPLASAAGAKRVLTVAWGWWRGGAGTQQVAPEHRREGWESQPPGGMPRCAWLPRFPGGGTAPASPWSWRQEGSSEGRHQPEVYLNVWLSAPPRPNPGRETEQGEHCQGQ